MKINKSQLSNIVFIVFILLLIIPQTRTPIQVVLHKGLALFGPSVIKEDNRTTLNNYNWKLKDINGNPYDFKEAKNKVVLVNFWATWCPPCIAEMPSMQKLYNDYKDKIDFVFVSDEDTKIVQQFLNDKAYSFGSFSPVSNNPKEFNVRSIPRTFLLDKEGNIVIDKTGATNWNGDKVREVIDELLN